MRYSSFARPLACSVLAVALAGCGDDGGGDGDAAPGDAIDASPAAIDADLSGVCPNAAASYAGVLENPAAANDGQTLTFFVDVDSESPPDRLRLSIDEGVAQKTGDFTLPDASWSVSLCLDDTDGSCSNALVASAGALHVSSVTQRFQASIDPSTFVDTIAAPTCSATLASLSFDVAIDAVP